MNEVQEQQFEKDRDEFVSKLDAPILLPNDGSGVGKSGLPLLFEYVKQTVEANGGYSSVSVFEVSLAELLKAGELVKLSVPDEPEIPQEIADYIQRVEAGRVSSFDVERRYRSDEDFRKAWDAHESSNLDTPQAVDITLEQYRSLPIAVIRRRMAAEPAFAAAVHKLLATGV